MAQVGRISGPLLFANLERNGIDLAFRNDLQTTQLLYLDVNTGRIAVNNDAPAVEIDITGTTRTVNLIANESNNASVANFTIGDNNISVLTEDLIISASEVVIASNIETEKFFISDNIVSTKADNTNIELRPNGTGSVNVHNNVNIYGNLYTPGNITFDGTITFGDAVAQDTVNFNSDVNSDIIPDIRNTYNLGNSTKRWDDLYTNLINGQSVNTQDIAAGGTLLNSRAGNIFYVATNGSDANVGDHIQGPLATIKEALARADASSGAPTVVHIFPGEYQEDLPLVVPSNVTVIGQDIRNVIVTPDTTSQSEDVFHLNGESTVQNLTVKGFFYDDVNNTGYAFRFAPGAVISTRSPYIQDITVITQGSNISQADPRGFNSGDAGKGAYINGAEMNSASFDASMLFHSCTFITPGVDAITMTNGVRVEWLNSFTYFADRGLYAVNGLTGRTSQDGSTVIYGAELRSIGSANVYGNFGAVADGADTLMYLIQHNMAYIGSAESAENDPSLTVQANEIVELNSGQIHYVTTDHTGSFRVGDNFFIDFETGSTSVDLSTLTADTLTGLVITNAGDTTIIDGRFIETGNFRIADNTIETLADDFDIDSATNTINLNNNSNITGNLDITGDFTFDGAISFVGDAPGDGVTFNVELEQDFNPNETMSFKLGSPSKEWLAAYLNRIEVGDFSIYDNVIETKTSNANLELRANSTGNVRISDSAKIDNNISVAKVSTFADVNINGILNLDGNFNITGNRSVSNDLTVTQNLSVGAAAQFENILINDNVITTTDSNSDLELRASGTGIVVTDNKLVAKQNVSFDNGAFDNNLTVDLNVTADNANVSNIEINDNYVQNTSLNTDLELRAVQDVRILDNTVLGQDLTVSGSSSLQSISITGLITHVGGRTQTGNYDIAGELFVDDILIEDNFITSTGNLLLEASGTGDVLVPTNNVQIDNNLTVDNNTTLASKEPVSIPFGTTTTLDNPDAFGTSGSDQFGSSVAISESYVIVGALGEDDAGGTDSGKVYIFDVTTGALIHTLDNPNAFGTSGSDRFGNEVAISGDRVIVAAELEDDAGGSNSGKAYIFDVTTGALIHTLDNPNAVGTSAGDRFGTSVAISGDRAIVAAEREDDAEEIRSGKAYIFDVTTGALIHTLDNPNAFGTSAGDLFGRSIAISGDRAIVGADQENDAGGSSSGKVYIFDVTDGSLLHTLDNPNAFGTSGSDQFGRSIAISGDRAIVGALGEDDAGGTDSGKAYIFDVTDGSLLHTLDNPNAFGTSGSDLFGSKVAISGDRAIVAAETEDDAEGIISGKVYIFDVTDGSLLHTLDNPNAFGTSFGDRFGTSVAISGDRVIVGVSGEDDAGGNSSGKAYIFSPALTFVNAPTDINITGTITHTGNRIETGNYSITGEITIDNILVEDNFITTINSNSNLELRASGTGTINLANNSLQIDKNLTVSGITDLQSVTITGFLNHTGNRTQTGNYDIAGELFVDDILFEDNFITSTGVNQDLEISADGDGVVNIPTASVEITNNLTTSGNTDLQDALVTGTITHAGNRIQTGNTELTGNAVIDGAVSISSATQFEDVKINGNTLTSTQSNSDLDLRASGTGQVLFNDSVRVSNNLFTASITSRDIVIDQDLDLNEIVIPPSIIEIDDNFISTKVSNADLELRATGDVVLQKNVSIEQDLTVNGNTGLQDVNVTGDITHISRTQIGTTEFAFEGIFYSPTGTDGDNYGGAIIGGDTHYAVSKLNQTTDRYEYYVYETGTNNLTSVIQYPNNTDPLNVYYQLVYQGTVGEGAFLGNLLFISNPLWGGNTAAGLKSTLGRVWVYNYLTGQLIDQIDNPNNVGDLTEDRFGETIALNKNYLCVSAVEADGYGGTNTKRGVIYVFDPSDRSLTRTIINPDDSEDNFGANMVLDDDILYVSSSRSKSFTGEVWAYNLTDGSLIWSHLNTTASGLGESIAVASNYLYVSNRVRELVRVFNKTTGEVLFDINNPEPGGQVFGFTIVTTDSLLFVRNEDNNSISVFELDGTFVRKIESASAYAIDRYPYNLAITANKLLVSDYGGDNAQGDSVGFIEIYEPGSNPIYRFNDLNRTQTGDYTQTGNLIVSGVATVSAATTVNNVLISGNKIDTTSGNLILEASGTGDVVFENLEAKQNITSGTLTTANISINGTLALEELESSTDIQIFDNVITTTNSNSDLELRANGTGDITLQELKFNTNTLSTDSSTITVSPAENFIIDSAAGLTIPVGSNTVLDTDGVLRFNTNAGLFEGFNGGKVSFNGVYSDDRQTSVTAHPTNNTVNLTVAGVTVGVINSQEINLHKVQVEDISINNNTVSTTASNADLELRTQAAGELVLDDLSLVNNQIKNNGANLIISHTDNGYAKIDSTYGAVFPTGTVAERPVADPEVGDTRFNTDDDVLEVWDGSTYVVAAGTSATISESEFNDLMFEYTLIFG